MPENAERKLTFCFRVERQLQRFRELIIYISEKFEKADHFGAVKLNKVLYHSDFRSYERFGIPITGVAYFKLKKGPAPKILVPVRSELEKEGAIRVEERAMGNRKQSRIVPLRKPFLDIFTQDELALVDEVIKELWHQTAEEVSNASHDIRWRTVNEKDLIPYESVFLSDEPVTEADVARTRELADKYGWHGF